MTIVVDSPVSEEVRDRGTVAFFYDVDIMNCSELLSVEGVTQDIWLYNIEGENPVCTDVTFTWLSSSLL